MHGDYLGNAACCITEGFVGFAEGIEHGEFGINLAQTFVVDNEQCVDVLAHFFNSVECLVDFLYTLPAEWYSDDAYREDVFLFCHLGNDRRCTSSSTATHTGSDKHHLGAVAEHGSDIFGRFFGCLTSGCGVVAGSKSVLSQLQFRWHY